MGMFDSLIFKCKKCGHKIDAQSKSGRCNLEEYTLRDLPIEAAIGMDFFRCYKCGQDHQLDISLKLSSGSSKVKYKVRTKEKGSG